MLRYAMNQLTTYRWSFEEDMYHYQRHGFQAASIWRRKLADFGRERGRELLADTGMGVASVTWAGGFTGVDGRSFDESVADATAALADAAELGAECLVVYSGGRNRHTRRHADRLLQAALDVLEPRAEAVNVPLALKPMHPRCADDWSFLTSWQEGVRLVEARQSPALKLCLDTYQFPGFPRSSGELAAVVPHLGLVQLSDSRAPHSIDQARCALGDGHTPIAEIVASLLEAGYNGSFDIELMGPDIRPGEYDRILGQALELLSGLCAV